MKFNKLRKKLVTAIYSFNPSRPFPAVRTHKQRQPHNCLFLCHPVTTIVGENKSGANQNWHSCSLYLGQKTSIKTFPPPLVNYIKLKTILSFLGVSDSKKKRKLSKTKKKRANTLTHGVSSCLVYSILYSFTHRTHHPLPSP